MTYLLDTVPICELRIDSIRLSLRGSVKLGMLPFVPQSILTDGFSSRYLLRIPTRGN